MFTGEQCISVQLEFRAMCAPVTVSIPNYVLRYLESFAERHVLPDGNIVFRKPSDKVSLPEMRVIPLCRRVKN